ncbi:MAG TPA: class I SAM-dependent methyltransferase [Thermoanaerobaculia bacterium]|nr:class I SAM-dependent methyltransferase [Thermoanaerobaculia bacterium]
MSWFSSRSAGSRKEQQGRVQTLPEPDVHRSLALSALFEGIRGRKVNVLDLGSAVGSNVEFLSQYGCKLFIEDLYAALSSRTTVEEGDLAGPEFFSEFLPLPEDTRFDVILAWDLFNYLHRKELVTFSEQLRRFSHKGTLLLALISYHKTIPAQPYRFKIKDEQNLVYERRTATERPSPRLAPAEVTGLLKGFRVDRSFLLKHGIQEYLLVRD